MNNLRKFNTEADYQAAELNYPAVSWIVSGDTVHFDKTAPTTMNGDLRITYNVEDIEGATQIYTAGGGSGSGSGSGSGGGFVPTRMWVDGVEETPPDNGQWQFSSTGEHIVEYEIPEEEGEKPIVDEAFSAGDYPSCIVEVEIGDEVTSIGQTAFNDCTSLTSITIPNSVTSIGNGAFDGCTSLTSIYIPNSVTSIGEYAFAECGSLTSIDIPSGLTSIGQGAFTSCGSLTSITIPNSITSIADETFDYCTSLSSVTIPNSVTSIGSFAFRNCTSLTSITIPSGVTSIGRTAFNGCSGLSSVTCFATTPPTLGTYVFDDTNNCPIYVPSASVSAYQSAWSAYASRIQAIS